MTELKYQFIEKCREAKSGLIKPRLLVVAIKLPSGSIETISNTKNLMEKMEYYAYNYDDSFKLKANSDVEVVNFMLV